MTTTTGFEAHSTAVLAQVRQNLLGIVAHVLSLPHEVIVTPTEEGKHAAPGAVLRSLVLPMLEGVETVLLERGEIESRSEVFA